MTASAPQIVALHLAGAPPNYRKVDWWSQRRAAAPTREGIAHLLAASGPAVEAECITARIVATFGDRRRRNPELYEPVLLRALGEALVECGWIVDCDQLSVESFDLVSGETTATLVELIACEASW
jgi:hypothetical protein